MREMGLYVEWSLKDCLFVGQLSITCLRDTLGVNFSSFLQGLFYWTFNLSIVNYSACFHHGMVAMIQKRSVNFHIKLVVLCIVVLDRNEDLNCRVEVSMIFIGS